MPRIHAFPNLQMIFIGSSLQSKENGESSCSPLALARIQIFGGITARQPLPLGGALGLVLEVEQASALFPPTFIGSLESFVEVSISGMPDLIRNLKSEGRKIRG